MIGAKIFFVGLVIFVFGRILAQYNNNDQANRQWIGAIVGVGMVVTAIGGITYIVLM